jgi:hypothetical protein
MEEIIAKKFKMLAGTFNERQRRLWAAAETQGLGYGGVSMVARATGISRPTIIQGIKELAEGERKSPEERMSPERCRRCGGGRKKATRKQPELRASLDALVEPTAKGDPMSPLRWTVRSTRNLSEILCRQGFSVSKSYVCGLLCEMGYQLAANRKSIEGGNNPDRNTQFEFINAQAAEFLRRGLPVISVDAKKKELIGNFKQNGQVWRPKGEPELVNVHDFPDGETGKAAPYGVYDLQKNLGWVNVGIDHDTAEFAVESVRRWYEHLGKELYPNASELYITADGGGSNASRSRLWKYHLQEFSDETRLTIHVSHFPPGTSKWNKIEHRLFNHISMNWKGCPLTSLDVIIELIGHTTSRTGLKVYARADDKIYPTGRQISDKILKSLNLFPNETLGKWNYKITPR